MASVGKRCCCVCYFTRSNDEFDELDKFDELDELDE